MVIVEAAVYGAWERDCLTLENVSLLIYVKYVGKYENVVTISDINQ